MLCYVNSCQCTANSSFAFWNFLEFFSLTIFDLSFLESAYMESAYSIFYFFAGKNVDWRIMFLIKG